MADSIFDGSVDDLIAIKNDVVERDNLLATVNELKSQDKKTAKEVAAMEKSIQDEINSTVKKRRKEIEAGFDKNLDALKAKRKKVASKKSQEKSKGVKERIKDETSDVSSAKNDSMKEFKRTLKERGVPAFLRTELFYTMFYPHGTEIFMMILGFIFMYGLLPWGIFYILNTFAWPGAKADPRAIIIPCIWVVLWLVVYFVVYVKLKIRFMGPLTEGREILTEAKKYAREEKKIRKQIKSDKDESQYGLGEFDDEMKAIDDESAGIMSDKEQALKVFDEDTKQTIIDEINGRRIPELEELKANKKDIEEKFANAEKQYQDKNAVITKEYTPFLGDDLLKPDKLDAIIQIMQGGEAATISAAVGIFKNRK